MIQVYRKENTDYEKNGDMTMQPEVCELDAQLNGPWIMTMTIPIDDDGRFTHADAGDVISAPTFVSDKQLFRIYNPVTDDTEKTVKARPIFMDAAGEVFILDKRPTGKIGQEALDEMLAGQSRYKGISDITNESTAYYIRKNLIEAIQSDDENSFLNRWGGEVWYDNYTILVNKRVGQDAGVRVEMGYNCTGIEEDINTENVVTRIIPVAYNGYTLEGDAPWVDSPLIGRYPTLHAKEIKFEDVKLAEDVQEGEVSYATLEELREELKKRCREQFELGVDKPVANYKCSMIDLADTEEYADLKGLEQVSLGDTVYCKNKNLGIETKARVVRVVYDCIEKCNKEVELGDFTYNYFNELASVMQRVDDAIDENGNVRGGRICGIIDGMLTVLRAQSTAAKKITYPSAIFEDLDPKSPLYGAMCMGTQGFMIARERTAEGWNWKTFGTARGFVADYIFAGKLLSQNYDEINKKGFLFDLDTGDLEANNCTLGGTFTAKDQNGNGVRIKDATVEFLYENKVIGNMYCVPGIDPGTGQVVSGGVMLDIFGAEGRFDVVINGKKMIGTDGSTMSIPEFDSSKSGKAEFSDGSYLQFTNGVLIGGKTSSGSTL